MIELGDFIKAEREKRKFTQNEVAKKVGITGQFLSNMERNVCGVPLDILSKLVDILKLDRHELIDYMVDKFRSNIEQQILKGKRKKK